MVESSSFVDSGSAVRVPAVHFYGAKTHVLVMQGLAPARSLSTVLIRFCGQADSAGTVELFTQTGFALGDFMGRFRH